MRTRRAAARAFVGSLQLATSCVSKAVLIALEDDTAESSLQAVILNAGSPAPLRSANGVSIPVLVSHRTVLVPQDRSWQVRLAGYEYTLLDRAGREIFAYHWHPIGRSRVTAPHLHLGAGALVGRADLAGAHLPTGHVVLQDVLRLLIGECGVQPLRSDWETVLAPVSATEGDDA